MRSLSMSDDLAASTIRLEQLVQQIMKERDSLRFDELANEIWRVLDERERLLSVDAYLTRAA